VIHAKKGHAYEHTEHSQNVLYLHSTHKSTILFIHALEKGHMAGSKATIVLYQGFAVIGGIENYFVPAPLHMQLEMFDKNSMRMETNQAF